MKGRMSVNEAVTAVQQDFVMNFNAWLAGHDPELEPLTYHDDAPDIETGERYMGIYLTSPEGEVFEGNGRSESVTVTLDCVVDSQRGSVNLPQRYLSCLLDFLRTRTYGIGSHAYTAAIARVDLEAPANMFVCALRIVTGYMMDCDL